MVLNAAFMSLASAGGAPVKLDQTFMARPSIASAGARRRACRPPKLPLGWGSGGPPTRPDNAP